MTDMIRLLQAAALGAAAMLTLASCGTSTDGPSPSAGQQPPPAAAALGPEVATPILGTVLAPPIAVPASDGQIHLVYELEITNVMNQEVTLTSLNVTAGAPDDQGSAPADKELLKLSGDQLAAWTRVVGTKTPTSKLGPSQSAMIWLDVVIDGASSVPTDLSHSIGLSVQQPVPGIIPATMTETFAATQVDPRKPVTIASPLKGPRWVDANGCCGMSPHRTAINPLNGKRFGAERYAIDFVQLTPDGALFAGDEGKVQSYPGFGNDILAVADGPVVAVVDGLPEQPPGQAPPGLPLDQYGGNHVIQDIGGGNYAVYAHLKTGSVKVKEGDQLKAGETLALLGNSGNTTAPHLHFQVVDAPSVLRASGLPFVFTEFRLDSRVASADAVDKGFDAGGPLQTQPGFTANDKADVMPLDLDIVTFPGG